MSVLQRYPYLFSPEKLTTFIGHHCPFYSFHSRVTHYFRHVALLQKFAGPLVGAPVWPNMLNMPKSGSVRQCALWSCASAVTLTCVSLLMLQGSFSLVIEVRHDISPELHFPGVCRSNYITLR